MSKLIKVTCRYYGETKRFKEVWVTKLYTKCAKCSDSNLKLEQIDLNNYYNNEPVTVDPPAATKTSNPDPIEAKVEEQNSDDQTDISELYDIYHT